MNRFCKVLSLMLSLILATSFIASCDKKEKKEPVETTEVTTTRRKVNNTPNKYTSTVYHGKLTIKGALYKLPKRTVDRLMEIFDEVYEDIWAYYNEGEAPAVTYDIRMDYDGVAATVAKDYYVKLNYQWLIDHPYDLDCMTHELVHVAQQTGSGNYTKYGWLVEGIADYGREKFGQYNTQANWKLPTKYNGGHYTDAYKTTAGFLKFIEAKHNPDIIKILNTALRTPGFNIETFKTATGYTVDELWELYKKG